MKWIAQPPSFYQVKPLSLSGLIYCCVSQTETELMTFHFVPIFNLKFSNTWGGRSPYFASLTDAGNVRVQMEAGFCPSSISQIQITLPSVSVLNVTGFSFGPMLLIRPRRIAALWSFSLCCTVAKKSAVSLLPLYSLWGCSPTAGTVHPVLFCLLMRHASAKGFTLWLESNSLIKMQLFNKAEMKHLGLMKTECFAILHGGF